jgi:hypothetical protein
MIDKVLSILSKHRFSLYSEVVLQRELFDVFVINKIDIEKEYTFNEQSRIDFFHFGEGLGIEVKIGGGRKNIYRQCERYLKLPEVKSLILVTNKAMLLPATINDKEVRVLNLGMAWL